MDFRRFRLTSRITSNDMIIIEVDMDTIDDDETTINLLQESLDISDDGLLCPHSREFMEDWEQDDLFKQSLADIVAEPVTPVIQMDFQNINNQGKEEDRFYLDQETYLYPRQKYIVTILEFGTHNDELEVGDIISTSTGKHPYDIGCNMFADSDDYPFQYRVSCHPIGYNYDQYLEEVDDLCGFDYYVIDDILWSSSEKPKEP